MSRGNNRSGTYGMTRPFGVLFVILDAEEKLASSRTAVAHGACERSMAFFDGDVGSSRNRHRRGQRRHPPKTDP